MRNSPIEVERRRDRVFQLLRLRATPEQVLEQLKKEGFKGASKRSLDRDYAALKQKAQEWLNGLGRDEFVSEYQNSIESIKERIRRLIVAELQAVKPTDKAEINMDIIEAEATLMDLLAFGPTILAIRREKASKVGSTDST